MELIIVHEALISHWQMLWDWKEEYKLGIGIERQIEAASCRLEERQRDRISLTEITDWALSGERLHHKCKAKSIEQLVNQLNLLLWLGFELLFGDFSLDFSILHHQFLKRLAAYPSSDAPCVQIH